MCDEYEKCSHCDGDGWIGVKTKRVECPGCDGLGKIPNVSYSAPSYFGDVGINWASADTCSQCNGERYITVPNYDDDRTDCSCCLGTGDSNYPKRLEAERRRAYWEEIERQRQLSEEQKERERQEECEREEERQRLAAEEREERERERREEEERISAEIRRRQDELIEERRRKEREEREEQERRQKDQEDG